jgi:hypothetical protein
VGIYKPNIETACPAFNEAAFGQSDNLNQGNQTGLEINPRRSLDFEADIS